VEFFSYGCPHCYSLEPTLEPWAKRLPADVVFKRVPVGFNALYENYQKIYYALEAMGQLEPMHRKVFAAIHQQRQRLDKEADIAAFMTANGVDGAKFLELYKSFSVQTKAKQAQQLSQSYKIDGVPAMGVQGRFVTSGSQAGSNERALAVTDSLVQGLRKPT
jgi:protein dithiol oxidoreductase (disulfide-forming)